MADQVTVVTDTSVLINFLVLDRVALLAALPGHSFVVTDHVRAEITDHYPEQLHRLDRAFQSQALQEMSVTDPAEVALFATLTATGLGIGDCSAIAVAAHRGLALALDDRTAQKRIRKLYPSLPHLTTESLVVRLIQKQRLSVADADAMKSEWERNHLCCPQCGRYDSDEVFDAGFEEPMAIRFKQDMAWTDDRQLVLNDKVVDVLKQAKVGGYQTKPIGRSGWHVMRGDTARGQVAAGRRGSVMEDARRWSAKSPLERTAAI